MKKTNFFIFLLIILIPLFIISCKNTDSKGGIGTEPYDDSVEDNNSLLSGTNEENNAETSDSGEGNNSATNTTIAKDNSIKIGFLYQETGNLSKMMDLVKKGFELGIGYMTTEELKVEGKPIKIIYKSTKDDIEVAKTNLKELYEKEGVILSVAATTNEIAKNITPIAKEYSKILFLDPSYEDDLTGTYWNKYIFKSSPNIYQRATALAKSINYSEEEVKAILITKDNENGKIASKAISKVFSDNSDYKASIVKHIEISNEDEFSTDGSSGLDFSPYIEEIKKANATHLVVFWDINEKEFSTAIKYSPLYPIIESGLKDSIKLFTEIPTQSILKTLDSKAEGIIGSTSYYYTYEWDMNEYLRTKANEVYSITQPDFYLCSGLTLASVIIEVLKRANGDFSTDNLIGLIKGKEFDSPKGFTKFREEDNQALQSMFIVKLINTDEGIIPEYYGDGELYNTDTEPPINNTNG